MTAAPRRIRLDGSLFWDLDGRLLPVLAGADPEALYPEVPEDLSTLDREALEALSAEITERAAIVTVPGSEGRDELIDGLSATDLRDTTTAALDARDRITAHLASLDATEAQEAADLAALATRATGETEDEPEAEESAGPDDETDDSDDDDSDDEPAEVEVEVEVTVPQGEALAAAAVIDEDALATSIADRLATRLRPRRTRTPARHQARETQGDRATMTITAGADVRGFAMGAEITEREDLGRAMQARMRTLGAASSAGDGEKVPVIQIRTELPEERRLGDDTQRNTEVMDTILGRQALTAAGGICAPPETLYDVPTFAVADRPVRDAIPAFNAPRGAITYMQPLTIASGIGADMEGASDFWTVANDVTALTDEDMRKDCLRIECGDFVIAEIEAIYRCMTIGNMDARTHPERVAALIDLAIAAQARKAEGRFLDDIKTASTTVSHGVGFGAMIDLVAAFAQARAGMISRHRMSPTQRFHAMMPAWLAEVLPVDQIRRKGDPDMVRATVQAVLERYGVSVSWYLDTPSSGVSQLIATQGAAALRDFPATAQIAFYPEGSFGYLDAGELDLGLVRDSTLNSTNDYQLFTEEFQKVFYRGVEALWINATLCYSGQVQAAGSIMDCAYNLTTDTEGS